MGRREKLNDLMIGRLEDWTIGRLGDWVIGGLGDWGFTRGSRRGSAEDCLLIRVGIISLSSSIHYVDILLNHLLKCYSFCKIFIHNATCLIFPKLKTYLIELDLRGQQEKSEQVQGHL